MKAMAALLLALAFLPSAAHAQSRYPIAGVCGWDIQQYCKGINPHRTRDLKACLALHDKDLYPRCKDHYKDAK